MNRQGGAGPRLARALGAGLVLGLAALPAVAQSLSTTPGVSVDLSVLGGATTRFPGVTGFPGTPGGLRPPPARTPQSRLTVDADALGATAAPPRTQAAAPRLTMPEQRPATPPPVAEGPPAAARLAPPTGPLTPPPAAPAGSRITAATPPPATATAAPATPAPPAMPAVAETPRAAPEAPRAAPAATVTPPSPAASAPATRPTPPAPQVAARAGETVPVPAARAPGSELRVMFQADSVRLPDTARPRLKTLAERLVANEAERVQLLAYAEGSADTTSQARRLSLSRALAVRTYLIDLGVRSTRMDVRALGPKSDDGPSDRVDVVVVPE